ncbi:hypothetical protein [Microlunatus flavus]|uniref:Uncharacterized protein n=1 Tax=Microlunatus flavus TaxID=1036181 RepID=A0A1H9NKE8_9ACTN|nr:hypothetical protein [Microlunatus flavus]SER36474.1 hypothetical protein SAMN05421756_1166 [Microlunatus flavus]
MQAWVVVMVVVLAVGLALTVYGALHDRTLNRRRAAEMLGPPERAIPNLPADARPPAYVTEAQARRRPVAQDPEKLGSEIETLRARLEAATTEPFAAYEPRQVAVGHASDDFVTDPSTRTAVLEDPLVLVCADAVETIRELLPALEHAVRAARPLVVVAPAIAPDVLGTLEVNAIQGKVPGVAVLADDAVRAEVAQISHATPVDATDRRSGWADPAAFGHLARWTSTRSSSRLSPLTRAGVAE